MVPMGWGAIDEQLLREGQDGRGIDLTVAKIRKPRDAGPVLLAIRSIGRRLSAAPSAAWSRRPGWCFFRRVVGADAYNGVPSRRFFPGSSVT
jgi:hypothetical protein